MQKPVKIHEFHPEIYPFRLWVVITENGEALKERFVYHGDAGEIDTSTLSKNEALTYRVRQREYPRYKGCLIVFSEKKWMSIKTIAHEATHAARWFWEYLGESPTGEEADAYLVGWIAQCIDEVKHFKTNKYETTEG